MASAPLDIWKLALLRIGNMNMPVSESDTTPEAVACQIAYPIARDVVFSEAAWPFLTKRVDLSELLETRIGWDFVYEYPSDCVMVLGGTDPMTKNFVPVAERALFRIEAKQDGTGFVIVSDTEALNITYISNDVAIGVWPIQFVNCIATRLALELALGLKKDQRMAEVMRQNYDNDLSAALAAAFSEASVGAEPDYDIIKSRL